MLIFIPNILITVATFPGVVIHEMSHRFFCDLVGVDVYKIKYFIPSDKILGYVLHEPTTNVHHQYLISMGPFIINTLLCALLTFPYVLPEHMFGGYIEQDQITQIIFKTMAWIGFSSGMHAFPSSLDLDQIEKINRYYPSESQFFSRVIESTITTFRFLNAIQFYIFQLVYALFVSKVLPLLLS
jgi:hypothetical protein